ncbi:MAG TPA: YceD family protein [Verrucomicrobiae bacterium]|nr:YceD family protein [Verrucomicrobiae bacterium]
MSLVVNIRHVEEHEIRLKGEMPVAELDFGVQDEMIRVEKPLKYDLQIEQLHDSLLVTGSLKLVLDCECVRCLKPFAYKLNLTGWALHLPLEGEDKVSILNDCIDLTPFVREDMLIEFPQHPLCKPECAGLKKKTKVQKDEAEEKPPSPWTELDKLKL